MATALRTKIEPAFAHFDKEVKKLIRFNSSNIGLRNSGKLNTSQIDLLVESVFFNSFRHYENFIREAFLLCCQEKVRKRPKIVSYIKAKNFEHTEKLIKSTSPFVDWAHPDKLIQRSELFLENGHPFKAILTTHRVSLLDFKRLRNHIAHDSMESLSDFKKVLNTHYGTTPLTIPSVGSHLLQASRINPAQTIIDDFFATIQYIASHITS